MRLLSSTPSILKRWIMFNSVGAVGFALQIVTLWILVTGIRMKPLLATGVAVETAVLHNFFWHENWTWADRTKRTGGGLLRRLLAFHMANGFISLAGNLVLMQLFVEELGLHYLLSNIISVSICAILNFAAGDRLVFEISPSRTEKGDAAMIKRSMRAAAAIFLLSSTMLLAVTASVPAAELQTDTLKAWRRGVEITERRISSELAAPRGFLALDFQDPPLAAQERQALLAGEIPIKQVSTTDGIHVPDGMIHHWRGCVFIPGIPLDFVLNRVKNPDLEVNRQKDVLASRVLERMPGQIKLYLKLQRTKFITVVYNTEHCVRFQTHGFDKASSSSVATKIAEIENAFTDKEREKPEGRDRGLLWRMNSYWRYQQTNGGVIVECESMTLSRSIPPFLEYIIRPLIHKTARESMHRTLYSLRTRMVRAYAGSPHAEPEASLYGR
jgi:putative flippase GtrA